MPRGTQAIIGANVVVFLLQKLMGGVSLIIFFGLWPIVPDPAAYYGPEVGFKVWQIVTYGFLHDPTRFDHIFFNMFAIYMFGSTLEQFFGTRYYVTLYFVSVVVAGLTQLVFNAVIGSPGYTVGASGGVFGLLLAFGMYFPQQRIMLLFPPIAMPAWVAVTGYAVLELVLGVTGTQQGVAHFAHLGGMLGAFVMIQWRRGKPPFPRPRR